VQFEHDMGRELKQETIDEAISSRPNFEIGAAEIFDFR
jgi:hypothetical protein